MNTKKLKSLINALNNQDSTIEGVTSYLEILKELEESITNFFVFTASTNDDCIIFKIKLFYKPGFHSNLTNDYSTINSLIMFTNENGVGNFKTSFFDTSPIDNAKKIAKTILETANLENKYGIISSKVDHVENISLEDFILKSSDLFINSIKETKLSSRIICSINNNNLLEDFELEFKKHIDKLINILNLKDINKTINAFSEKAREDDRVEFLEEINKKSLFYKLKNETKNTNKINSKIVKV